MFVFPKIKHKVCKNELKEKIKNISFFMLTFQLLIAYFIFLLIKAIKIVMLLNLNKISNCSK